MVVLVGGRLYALAHGVRQKIAHHSVAAGATVWDVNVVEGILPGAGGQRCSKAAALALGDGGTAGGASSGSTNGVDHEGAVFVSGLGDLGAGVRALPFFFGLDSWVLYA